MTNEVLAELIQQGDNDELLPVLWEKTARLLYKMSAQKYALHKEALKQHGIEPEDLNQECYTVLLGAVKAYDSNKGYMLSTYFGYQFKQVLRKLLNGADVLDRIDTKSFDAPMTDEEDAPTRGDITPDPESGAGFDRVDMLVWRNTELFSYRTSNNLRQTSYYAPLHKALDSLPDVERNIIIEYYFKNFSFTKIGKLHGFTKSRAYQAHKRAIWLLRHGQTGRRLFEIYGSEYKCSFNGSIRIPKHKSVQAFKRSHTSEIEDYVIWLLSRDG